MANEKNTIVGKGRMDYNKKQGNCKKAGIYMEEERDMRYEKFQTTGQERIRLACALEGFFLTNE
mgnify:CR=1 FL=1